jgi:hypothetical protein
MARTSETLSALKYLAQYLTAFGVKWQTASPVHLFWVMVRNPMANADGGGESDVGKAVLRLRTAVASRSSCGHLGGGRHFPKMISMTLVTASRRQMGKVL